MQRILSVQTSRSGNESSSEFVTKRLCCSFLFSATFIALLGGFLLGRYSTQRENFARIRENMNEEIENFYGLTDAVVNFTETIDRIRDIPYGFEAGKMLSNCKQRSTNHTVTPNQKIVKFTECVENTTLFISKKMWAGTS